MGRQEDQCQQLSCHSRTELRPWTKVKGEPLVQLLCGTGHKSHGPKVQWDLNTAKPGWNRNVLSMQRGLVATLRQELSTATKDVEIPEPTKAVLIR